MRECVCVSGWVGILVHERVYVYVHMCARMCASVRACVRECARVREWVPGLSALHSSI